MVMTTLFQGLVGSYVITLHLQLGMDHRFLSVHSYIICGILSREVVQLFWLSPDDVCNIEVSLSGMIQCHGAWSLQLDFGLRDVIQTRHITTSSQQHSCILVRAKLYTCKCKRIQRMLLGGTMDLDMMSLMKGLRSWSVWILTCL